MSTGAELIAAERDRQITNEGYTPEDDRGKEVQLVRAVQCYVGVSLRDIAGATNQINQVPIMWPWMDEFWKPTGDPIRDLTKWGNPITMSDVGAQYRSLDDRGVATLVVRDFRVLATRGRLAFPNWRFLGGRRGAVEWTYPGLDEIRAELAGHDLACWCPLDQPCHADVLLELANAQVGEGNTP